MVWKWDESFLYFAPDMNIGGIKGTRDIGRIWWDVSKMLSAIKFLMFPNFGDHNFFADSNFIFLSINGFGKLDRAWNYNEVGKDMSNGSRMDLIRIFSNIGS